MAVLTLLTDFGEQDVYVGVLKGVIAQIAPAVAVIDLTHGITDIPAASFALASAFPYFGLDTIHVAVVDPGVGSDRRAVAVQFRQGTVIAPDNGLVDRLLAEYPVLAAVHLDNPVYWLTASPSATFHGRDIFAPAAAHLAKGATLKELGTAIEPSSLVRLAERPGWYVQYIDRFGNLISNIPAGCWDNRQMILLKGQVIPAASHYGAVPVGSAIALIGSHGYLEIAVNQGSAAQYFDASVGEPLILHPLISS